MGRVRWKYAMVPREFYDRRDIPSDSTVWKRYPELLGDAWIETGSQYAYSTASNERLAEIWQIDIESARKTLAEMRKFKLVSTEQVGRTGRLIKILVAYRGQGQDSAPETNAAGQRESRMEAHPHASVAQAQPKGDPIVEDGCSTPTLEGSTNDDVVHDLSINDQNVPQHHQALSNPGCTSVEGGCSTPTLENKDGNSETTLKEIFDLLDRIEIDEPNRTRVAHLPHMTYEYLLPWVHHAEDHQKLGGGYYVVRFDAADVASKSYRDRAVRREVENERMAQMMDHADDILKARQEAKAAIAAQNPYVQDHAMETWESVKAQLQLMTTKQAFEARYQCTHALGWDGEQLVVSVRSNLDKEWIEARGVKLVEQAVEVAIGRPVAIRYEVRA